MYRFSPIDNTFCNAISSSPSRTCLLHFHFQIQAFMEPSPMPARLEWMNEWMNAYLSDEWMHISMNEWRHWSTRYWCFKPHSLWCAVWLGILNTHSKIPDFKILHVNNCKNWKDWALEAERQRVLFKNIVSFNYFWSFLNASLLDSGTCCKNFTCCCFSKEQQECTIANF